MATRTELSWEDIKKDVLEAMEEIYSNKRFVTARVLAQHIQANESRFPQFENCTYKTTVCRVSETLRRENFPRYTNKGCRNSVFINPSVEA